MHGFEDYNKVMFAWGRGYEGAVKNWKRFKVWVAEYKMRQERKK